MRAIDSLRKEFFSLLKDTELVDSNMTTCNSWSYDEHLIRAVIFCGLYPGICSVVVSHEFPICKVVIPSFDFLIILIHRTTISLIFDLLSPHKIDLYYARLSSFGLSWKL